MESIVLDNNILFSLMNPFSTASYIFAAIGVSFLAPEFINEEFNEHIALCLKKSGLSEHEFEIRMKEIEHNLVFVKLSEYEEYLGRSIETLSDPDDVDFLALALKTKSVIWSNDLHLKEQSLIRTYSTKDLVDMLLSGEI